MDWTLSFISFIFVGPILGCNMISLIDSLGIGISLLSFFVNNRIIRYSFSSQKSAGKVNRNSLAYFIASVSD